MFRYYGWREGNGPWELWKAKDWDESKRIHGALDTDRLLMWDWDKHNALCLKHFGDTAQMWNDRAPEKISAFLSDWLEKPVRLVKLQQWNNAASGHPGWTLTWQEVPQ